MATKSARKTKVLVSTKAKKEDIGWLATEATRKTNCLVYRKVKNGDIACRQVYKNDKIFDLHESLKKRYDWCSRENTKQKIWVYKGAQMLDMHLA